MAIETHFSSQCETTVIQINATERGEQKHRIRVRLSHSPDDCVDGYGDRLMPLNRIAVLEFLVGSTPHAQVRSPGSNPKFNERHQVIHQRRTHLPYQPIWSAKIDTLIQHVSDPMAWMPVVRPERLSVLFPIGIDLKTNRAHGPCSSCLFNDNSSSAVTERLRRCLNLYLNG